MEGGGRGNAAVQALIGEILHITLTKARREGGNSSLFSRGAEAKKGEIQVGRGFMKLLIAGCKVIICLHGASEPRSGWSSHLALEAL